MTINNFFHMNIFTEYEKIKSNQIIKSYIIQNLVEFVYQKQLVGGITPHGERL